MVRAATLVMSVGLEAAVNEQGIKWTGGQNSGKVDVPAPGSGWSQIHTQGGLFSQVHSTITYGNYKPALPAASGSSILFLSITGEMDGNTESNFGTSSPKVYTSSDYMQISGPTIKVSETEQKRLYTAQVKFKSLRRESQSGLELLYNGATYNFGNITPLPFNGGGFKHNDSEWN